MTDAFRCRGKRGGGRQTPSATWGAETKLEHMGKNCSHTKWMRDYSLHLPLGRMPIGNGVVPVVTVLVRALRTRECAHSVRYPRCGSASPFANTLATIPHRIRHVQPKGSGTRQPMIDGSRTAERTRRADEMTLREREQSKTQVVGSGASMATTAPAPAPFLSADISAHNSTLPSSRSRETRRV